MARRLSKDDSISNVYYDLENGFGSIDETLKKAKAEDPSINRVDVSEWMKKQPNKQIRRYRCSNSYTAPFARYEYISNRHYGYETFNQDARGKSSSEERRTEIVVVIDIFSKLANVVRETFSVVEPIPFIIIRCETDLALIC